jgi:hypothetical protein
MEPRKDSETRAIEQDLEVVRQAWAGLEPSEPPELLDQAVLNTARRELEGNAKRRSLGWLGAFATAAVVVLALAIVVQQHDQAPVPPVLKSDGFKLEAPAALPASKAGEIDTDQSLHNPEIAAGDELRMQRAAPGAAAVTSITPEQPTAAVRLQTEKSLDVAESRTLSAAREDRETSKEVIAADEAVQDVAAEDARLAGPEAWIKRLLQLKQEGRDEEFRNELTAFRSAYPDHPLPPELID